MSKFQYDVSEPADDAASEVAGGTVHLDDLRVVGGVPSWRVDPADVSVQIVPESAGEVEIRRSYVDRTGTQSIVDRGVVNFGLIVLILLIAVLVIHDMFSGTITFAQFVEKILYFLAGVGLTKQVSSASKPM